MLLRCIMGLHKFGHKLKKAGRFANKHAKKATKIGMKVGKGLEVAGEIGEQLGVPGSEEVVMAGKTTQKVSKKIEKARAKTARATRGI